LFLDHGQHFSGAAILRCFDSSEFCLGGGWIQDFESGRTVRLPGSFEILNHERTSQPVKRMAGRIFTAKLSGEEKERSGSLFRRERMKGKWNERKAAIDCHQLLAEIVADR
jgi:hypothetical protein